MSGPRIPISPELIANIQRFKDRPWHDSTTQAFEQGTIPTKPAAQPTASTIRANRIISRQPPRSPDRTKSRERRRKLGGSSALPDTLRPLFTEGQRAVLCIIMMEVKRRRICDWPIGKIGALAGVCRTMVQATLHEGRRVGLLDITERPMRGQKSKTHLIRIISKEWLIWIGRARNQRSAG
jgi:hypothetical protein